MSPKLKPLLLPQLVEQRRRKLERSESEGNCYVYVSTDNLSSSDIGSPMTPTFSRRSSHARYSSSSSSLELTPSLCCDSPASPGQLAHQPQQGFHHAHSQSQASTISTFSQSIGSSTSSYASSSSSVSSSAVFCAPGPSAPLPSIGSANANKPAKRSLPDVQEEELLDRDEDEADSTMLAQADDFDDLYDCLCVESCAHHQPRPALIHSATFPNEIEYDPGFLSDSDFDSRTRTTRGRRDGSRSASRSGFGSPFSGLTARFSSRLTGLSRWRAAEKRAAKMAFSPASDPALEYHRPSVSIAASSRSSSVSDRHPRTLDRSAEPPLPPTPALSLYENHDSTPIPAPLDAEAGNAADLGRMLERDRAHATTPLLPPLITDHPLSRAPSAPQSPLEFPRVEPVQPTTPIPVMEIPQILPSPALRSKQSVSSLRHSPGSSIPPMLLAADMRSQPKLPLTPVDAWSDRLGYANWTIESEPPPVPATVDLDFLQALLADTDQALRISLNHVLRMVGHYDSKRCQFAQAKLAETEQVWRPVWQAALGVAPDAVVKNLEAWCKDKEDLSITLRWAQDTGISFASVPRIHDLGKFPDLGDEDIVGPMTREAVMTPPRDSSPSRGANTTSRFWRGLVGKVGLRK